ncbi:MAG: hypothetical protein V9G14_04310 [Cypionkella sp.]
MAIASVKASLVAGWFMHLASEQRMIYAILGFTAFFFLGMMLLTMWAMQRRSETHIPLGATMSLKSFHVFFIVSAFLLSMFLGGWCLNEYVTGSTRIGRPAAGSAVDWWRPSGLVVYGRYFLKKLKNIDYF